MTEKIGEIMYSKEAQFLIGIVTLFLCIFIFLLAYNFKGKDEKTHPIATTFEIFGGFGITVSGSFLIWLVVSNIWIGISTTIQALG